MTERNSGDAWVCTDCYFAHHCGAHEIKPEDADQWNKAGWYAGDSDTPCDREPLAKLDGYDLFDNTCSDHDVEHVYDDDGDRTGETTECPHCGITDFENGITEFSWSSCNGCGSTLGGSRYRLHWEET